MADSPLDVVSARVADDVAVRIGGSALRFGTMREGAERFAGLLAARGVRRGDPVVLLMPNGEEFFPAFYGVQRSGGIAVPLFPRSGPARVEAIAQACGARIVVVPHDGPRPQLTGLEVVSVADDGGGRAPRAMPHGDDPAFVQYTSGTTGDAKGVVITHANLAVNTRQLIDGMEITDRDVLVSWLPVYHDMGLILMTMCPFASGAQLVLLPTSLHAPSWLRAIEQWRATLTGAPDFAYRMCLRQVRADKPYDLSSLRVAVDAAEPVRESTVRGFEERFDLTNVVMAGYGLAEATVGVSVSPPGAPLRVDERGIVSAGPPLAGIEVATIEGDEPASIGEIVVRSPANCRGYVNDPAATKALFWRDEWVRTGDIGYVDADGWIFVSGRAKSVIKRAGETIAPREVEEAVEAVEGVRNVAALGIPDRTGDEALYVFAEARRRSGDLAALGEECVRAVHGRMGFRPARVYVVSARTIPRTYNGKVRYSELRDTFLDGTLRSSGAILHPYW